MGCPGSASWQTSRGGVLFKHPFLKVKVFLDYINNNLDVSKCIFIAGKLKFGDKESHTEKWIFKSLEQANGQVWNYFMLKHLANNSYFFLYLRWPKVFYFLRESIELNFKSSYPTS